MYEDGYLGAAAAIADAAEAADFLDPEHLTASVEPSDMDRRQTLAEIFAPIASIAVPEHHWDGIGPLFLGEPPIVNDDDPNGRMYKFPLPASVIHSSNRNAHRGQFTNILHTRSERSPPSTQKNSVRDFAVTAEVHSD